MISIKLQSNFIEILLWHLRSHINLLYILSQPFLKLHLEAKTMKPSYSFSKYLWGILKRDLIYIQCFIILGQERKCLKRHSDCTASILRFILSKKTIILQVLIGFFWKLKLLYWWFLIANISFYKISGIILFRQTNVEQVSGVSVNRKDVLTIVSS